MNKFSGRVYAAYPLETTSKINFTEAGNSFEIGYWFQAFTGTRIFNVTGYDGPLLLVLNGWIWIQEDKIVFPYTAVSLLVERYSLAVNGSLLTNQSDRIGYDIIPFTTTNIGIYRGNLGPALYFVNQVENYKQVNISDVVNSGNYTFNLRIGLVPVFEIGPYWIKGSPQEINYQWSINLITSG